MTRELFLLPHASEQTLTTMLVGGFGGGVLLVLGVLFMIWRDKRRGLGRFKPRPQRARTRKAQRRA
ncbi:MAG: hypothetical protein DI587_37370 [Variovorax paradoxus]|nr:MAG: hypothetical protein DI583_37370 [Variovorax paradoxus]PZQ00121.1 MAG: hypothetical protein DI587_37370 [Variovorax paradoxus]